MAELGFAKRLQKIILKNEIQRQKVGQNLLDSGWAAVPCFLASGVFWCSTEREREREREMYYISIHTVQISV